MLNRSFMFAYHTMRTLRESLGEGGYDACLYVGDDGRSQVSLIAGEVPDSVDHADDGLGG